MERLMDISWRDRLAGEWEKDYFLKLEAAVREEYRHHTVYPPVMEMFSALNMTPWDDVKVVILGQDPYHGPGQANGMCFSVAPGVPMPPSLVNIFKEVSADTGAPTPANGDLSRWARQGVLLLNSILTVRAGQAASHASLGWATLTDVIIETLAREREGLVFMLWGSHAARKGASIDPSRHLVLTSVHPSPLSAHRGFFGNHHFSRANAWLTAQGKEPIVW